MRQCRLEGDSNRLLLHDGVHLYDIGLDIQCCAKVLGWFAKVLAGVEKTLQNKIAFKNRSAYVFLLN